MPATPTPELDITMLGIPALDRLLRAVITVCYRIEGGEAIPPTCAAANELRAAAAALAVAQAGGVA